MRTMRSLGSALAITAAGVGGVASAGTPESSASFVGPPESQIWLGLGYLSEDNYHFGRYTGPVEEGVYPDLHFDLRYQGEGEEGARFGRLEGRDLGLDSRRLRGRYGVQGEYGTYIEYDERPRFFDEGVRSPLRSDGPDRLRLPEGGSTDELEEHLEEWDVETERQRIEVGGQRHLTDEWKVDASFSREEKEGRQYRGYGDWTRSAPRGFEMPAPVNHRTDQFDVGAEYADDALQARFGYHLSAFSQMEGDAFRVDDPSSADDWGDAETQTLSHPPDNIYHRISGSGAYHVAPGTRVSGQLDLGRAQQDEDFVDDPDFEDELEQLPGSLDGQIDTTRLGVRGTHRLHELVRVRASYRYDDRDNDTPEFDALHNDRDTRAHGWTRQTAEVDADIRLPGRNTLLAGYTYDEKDREYADDETVDDIYRARLRSRPTDNLSTTLRAQYTDRYGANYAGTALEENIPEMRMYHLTDMERLELGGVATYNVLPELALGLEVTSREDDYVHSEAGLTADERLSVTLSADYFHGERFSGYTYVTLEDGDRDLGGDNRSLSQEEEALTVGAGVEATVTEDGRLSVGTDLMHVASDTDIDVRDPDGDQAYPTLSTSLTRLDIYGEYEVTEAFQTRLAYVGQTFDEDDWALDFAPDADSESEMLLMGRESYDYTAHMVVGSVGYRF